MFVPLARIARLRAPRRIPAPNQLFHLHLVPRRRELVQATGQVPRSRVSRGPPAEHRDSVLHTTQVPQPPTLRQAL